MLRFRAAGIADADALAPRLRAADLREIQAVTSDLPAQVLADGIARSDPCFAVTQSDLILATFGVIPSEVDRGFVWLLGSRELVAYPLQLLRQSRRWLPTLHERYHTLYSLVDARNEVHVHWLQWCGFTLQRTIPDFGIEKRPFHEFIHQASESGHRSPACLRADPAPLRQQPEPEHGPENG